MDQNMGICHSILWVTYTPISLCQLVPHSLHNRLKNEMAKGEKGEMFYITVKELAKVHKVMYHSWKNHVWCITWQCNITKQTCTYTLCYWWQHSLMKLNCEMSKTYNKYTYSNHQTSSMVIVVEWWRCFRFNLEYYLLTLLIYMYIVLALWDPDAMCDKSGKPIYICSANEISWLRDQSLKWNEW